MLVVNALQMLTRAWNAGLERIVITGGSLHDSRIALEMAKKHERSAV